VVAAALGNDHLSTVFVASHGMGRAGRRHLVGTGAAAALTAGIALLIIGCVSQEPAPPGPVETRTAIAARPTDTPIASSADASPDRSALPLALPESAPTGITIPSVGVSGSFVPLGLTDSGALSTPDNESDVGWFTGAHSPGARGVAVVAGHVTYNGPAVFFRLGELQPGAEIEIARSDGSTAVFTVRSSATFAKTAFPSDQVYRPSDHAELVLITCGGRYADAHYDSNIIVWADLTTVR
jgi:sortase (surface protein transpeptidase)